MGIYSRKRNKSGFRIFVFCLFIFSIFIVLGYYFFYPNNLKNVLDENFLDKVAESQNKEEVVSKINESEYSQSEIEINFSNYLKISDLDKSIKDFIQNNPEFIIDVLRNIKMSKIKLSKKNKSIK